MAGGHYERDMYRQLMETMERMSQLEKKQKIDIAVLNVKYGKEIKGLKEKHESEVKQLNERINTLEGEKAQLKKENALLREDIERLKSDADKNSGNSSKPPSSDINGKGANRYNGRTKSGKPSGGQKGHSGKTLNLGEVEERIKRYGITPEIETYGTAEGKYVKRYILDLVTRTRVRELRFYADGSGAYHIPEECKSAVTYGESVKAFVIHLYTQGVVSVSRICETVESMSGGVIRLSEGTVENCIRAFAKRSEPVIASIQTDIMNARVIYTDATNVSVNGKQTYIRNFSTERSVLYIDTEKKNLAELGKIELLKRFTGTLVHDHETALYHFGLSHGECNVHLLRYLRKNEEDTGHEWSKRLSEYMNRMRTTRNERRDEKKPYTEEELMAFESEYDQIIKEAREEMEKRPWKWKWARRNELALLNRLEKYKAAHLLFLRDFDVRFDNNLSERDLRKCKNRQKMAGGFRKQKGSELFCALLSFIETCKRRSYPVFESIRAVWAGAAPFDLA